MVGYCRGKGILLIVGCDANSHLLVKGSIDPIERGQQLFEYMTTIDLDIRNTGKVPKFRNVIRDEVLDLILCNLSMVDQIQN